MKLSKFEAAKRHVDFAIECYFNGNDIVPICAVVGAAHIIAHDLVEHKKSGNSWASIGSEAAGIKIGEALGAIRKVPNWLKHARSDPEATLEFNSNELDFLLFHTILDFGGLNLKDQYHSNEVSVFQLWFVSKYKHLFTASDYSELVKASLDSFPGLDDLSEQEQLKTGLAMLAEVRNSA